MRDVVNQPEGRNHRPVVYLTVAENTVSAPCTTKMELNQHRTSVLTKNIHIYDKDINKDVSEFTGCILQAAKEAIPKGEIPKGEIPKGPRKH